MAIQIDIRDIECISAIDKAGGVTAAAGLLNISQPALSIYISNLEKRLGITLFEHVGRKLQLSYAGRIVLDEGRQMLILKKNIEGRLMNIKTYHEGKIIIGVPIMRGISFIPSLITEFSRYYPDIEIEILEENYGMDLSSKLSTGDIDVAFMNETSSYNHLECTLIKEESVVLFTSPDSPLIKKAVYRPNFPYPWIDLNSCKDLPFLQSPPNQITSHLCNVIFEDYQFQPRIKNMIRNQLTAIRLAANGYGLFIAPEYFANKDLINSPLSILSLGKDSPYSTNYICAVRKTMYRSQPLEKLIEIAKTIDF